MPIWAYVLLALVLLAVLSTLLLLRNVVSAPRYFEGVVISKESYLSESRYGSGRRGYLMVKADDGQTFPLQVPYRLFERLEVGTRLRRSPPHAELEVVMPQKPGVLRVE